MTPKPELEKIGITPRSELGEDVWIWENLMPINVPGTYLDLGCAHSLYNSNTAFLREMEWSGVGVDANPAWRESWSTPFVCALISCNSRVPFEFNRENPGMTRIGSGPIVPAKTAQSILDQYDSIYANGLDFLSMDLEGHEYEALMSLDLKRWMPSIIVSEYNTMGLPMDYRVRDYLLQNGYRLAHTTSSNFIFTRGPQ